MDISVKKEYTGFWVDAAIAERPDLTNATKLLLGLVTAMIKLYGACDATSGYMGRCLHLNRNTVDTALSSLELKGLIQRKTTRAMSCTKRTILLGEAYPKKEAALPQKLGGDNPKNRWSLDTTVRSIKEDEDGVASRLPRPPVKKETLALSSETGTACAALTTAATDDSHVQLILEWSAQVVTFIRKNGKSRRSADLQLNPASYRTASDPMFMMKTLAAYPGSDDPLVFRQHLRRAASTRILRDALSANVCKGYARSRFGVDELAVDALTMAGKSRKMPELCRSFYDRPIPEPITAAQLAAVTDDDVADVMSYLREGMWGDECWMPCIREIAARAKSYGLTLDAYLKCADAVQLIFNDTPYLWIADSLTREEALMSNIQSTLGV